MTTNDGGVRQVASPVRPTNAMSTTAVHHRIRWHSRRRWRSTARRMIAGAGLLMASILSYWILLAACEPTMIAR